MLPEMTADGLGMNFFDALFTSTSATCVTGLMIENTETFFTHKGHVVLMVLIKLGGLNIIAFGSLIAVLARFGVGVRQHDVIEDFVNRGSILQGCAASLAKTLGTESAIERGRFQSKSRRSVAEPGAQPVHERRTTERLVSKPRSAQKPVPSIASPVTNEEELEKANGAEPRKTVVAAHCGPPRARGFVLASF